MTAGIFNKKGEMVHDEKGPLAGSLADEIVDTDSNHSSENMERDSFTGKLDFMMSCVSYAVGLGNIWRFPYLCYRNGGAVFLIPYIFFLIVCGMPLFFMEVSYGQFASLSPITIWHLSPLFRGIGYGMIMITSVVCIYYNVIITWTVYYLFKSFTTELPWATCDNEWNTDACALKSRNNASLVSLMNDNSTEGNVTDMMDNVSNILTNLSTTVQPLSENVTEMMSNFSHILTNISATVQPEVMYSTIHQTIAPVVAKIKQTTPSEEFWERHVLKITDGIEDMGNMRWELFGCLLLSWILVFLCLIKGAKSSGKVMYFTATFPYMVLLCLLVRAATLDGAIEGIKFYLIPKWERLLDLKVWGDAASQIFYSVGAAWGALITMASYSPFKNNCYRDARIIPLINCGTSIFAGFVIFSIIGFMAHETGSTVEEVVRQGPGLVFVVYPEAVAKFPAAPFWSILFFSMLLSIGIGSQIAMFQTVTSAFIDEFDFLKSRKLLLTITLCVLEFILGIPCVMQGGMYYLQIMDWYGSTFSLMVLAFFELVVISWVYGVNRFYTDIELMIGYKPCLWWKFLWSYFTPAVIIFVFSVNVFSHEPVTYGDYHYPPWAIGIGWVFAIWSMVPLPAMFIFQMCRAEGSFIQRFRSTSRSSVKWGPMDPKDRERYILSVREEGGMPPIEDSVTSLKTLSTVGSRSVPI